MMNSTLFLLGFLSLIASLQATGVALSLYRYSQLVLLLHSHDRHAFCCLVTVPAVKIISLAERYSPINIFVIAFKIISVTGRPTLRSFFSVAPSYCFVELFSRLTATLRVVF